MIASPFVFAKEQYYSFKLVSFFRFYKNVSILGVITFLMRPSLDSDRIFFPLVSVLSLRKL